jgi:hypothetical protein
VDRWIEILFDKSIKQGSLADCAAKKYRTKAKKSSKKPSNYRTSLILVGKNSEIIEQAE